MRLCVRASQLLSFIEIDVVFILSRRYVGKIQNRISNSAWTESISIASDNPEIFKRNTANPQSDLWDWSGKFGITRSATSIRMETVADTGPLRLALSGLSGRLLLVLEYAQEGGQPFHRRDYGRTWKPENDRRWPTTANELVCCNEG